MTHTVRLTTAQALVKFLNQQYLGIDGKDIPFVEGVFAIYGHGNVLGVGEALEQDSGRLQIIHGKNEQGMAQAAVAFSKQSLRRKIYAVSTSIGPGSANLVTAAATALANHIPVLLLPADTFASRQPDPVLQQVEQEYSVAVTTNDALKPVSRYWDRITRPEQIMSSLLRAFEVMTDPAKAGPATISLSQDVAGEAYEFPVSFFNKRIHYVDRREPSARELHAAVELLQSSKKPLIVVGGGAKYSGAGEELIALSNACNIPIVETQAGKSTVASSHAHNLGGVGVTGTKAANLAAKDADLVIGVGTRYTDFTSSSKTAFAFDQAKFLNINISRMQASKMDGVQVIADAQKALSQIRKAVGGYASMHTDVARWKKDWKRERERLKTISFVREGFQPEINGHFLQGTLNEYADSLKTELPQTTALLALNEALTEDSVVVSAAGSLPGDLQRLWEAEMSNTYHLEYGYSCMGYEISGGFGVKLAEPNKEVYALVGDGSFLMMHSELITAIQYGYKLNVVLFDNAGFGCISNLQMDHGSDSHGCEFRTSAGAIMNIDYAKVAEAYGAKAYRVHTKEELEAAVKDARQHHSSTFIEIKVLPKTMTGGYESWWNVGVAETSTSEAVQRANRERTEQLGQAKRY